MKKRGFTLVELLAIILILAIIALITVPMIVTLIRNARKSVFKSNAEQVLSTAKMYYSKNITDDGVIIEIRENQVNKLQYMNDTTNSEALPGFHVKGKLPQKGKITITDDGKIAFDLYNGDFCAYKTEEANTIYILEGDNCDKNVKIPKIEGTVTTKDKDKLVVVASGFYEEDNVRTPAKIVRYGFKIDNGDWKYTTNDYYVFSGLKSGSTHNIKISCTNEVGITVEKDLGNKTVSNLDTTVISAPTGWAKSKTVTITYPKGRYKYQYSLDEGVTWLSDGITNGVRTLTYSSESDNGKYVMARVLDKTGNVEEAKVLKIAGIDTTPPNVPTISACLKTSATNISSCSGLSAIPHNTWKKGWALTIPSSTDSSGSAITYYHKTTGALESDTSTGAYKNVNTEGVTYVQYKACDAAGNCSAYSEKFIIRLDRTGPVCTTSYTSGSSSWTNGSVSIKGACSSDAGVGCNTSVVATKTISAATNGNVSPGKVQDTLGNETTCPSTGVHIDLEAPTCTTTGGRNTWSNAEVKLTGTCEDTGGSGCKSNTVSTTVTGDNVQIAKVEYEAHEQDLGWMGVVSNGDVGGITGHNKRLEAISMGIAVPGTTTCSIRYMPHIANYGWDSSWTTAGSIAGTEGQSRSLEAIKIELTGDCADMFDVMYRAHVQDTGWMSWVSNGAVAGTTGQSKNLEAIQVYLKPKSGSGYTLVNYTPVMKIRPGVVYDNAGNHVNCPKAVAAVDDGAGPTITGPQKKHTLTNTSGGALTCGEVGVGATALDSKSGVQKYQKSADNATWIDVFTLGNPSTDNPTNEPHTAKQNHTLYYRACDYAGNCGASASTVVHIGTFTNGSTSCSVGNCGGTHSCKKKKTVTKTVSFTWRDSNACSGCGDAYCRWLTGAGSKCLSTAGYCQSRYGGTLGSCNYTAKTCLCNYSVQEEYWTTCYDNSACDVCVTENASCHD